MRPLVAALLLLGLAGCAASNIDKRILCLDGQAHFVMKLGPVAQLDRAPDADVICKPTR